MSEYYKVEIYAAGDEKWAPIKSLERISGQLVIKFNSGERLSLEQAQQRYEHLSSKFRTLKFRVWPLDQ